MWTKTLNLKKHPLSMYFKHDARLCKEESNFWGTPCKSMHTIVSFFNLGDLNHNFSGFKPEPYDNQKLLEFLFFAKIST